MKNDVKLKNHNGRSVLILGFFLLIQVLHAQNIEFENNTIIENVHENCQFLEQKELLEYELIESNGRAELPGNPRLYVTTQSFLELFDLGSLSELPVASNEFEEKTQEMTLFTYDADEDELKAQADAEKEAQRAEEAEADSGSEENE